MRSPVAAPVSWAACFMSVSAAAENTGSVVVAATATVRLAGSTRPPPGWTSRPPICCRSSTFWLRSQFLRSCGCRCAQKVCYHAMFQRRPTLREVASTPGCAPAELGLLGVLQTWGRDLPVYHPHIHFVVAGGGVSEDGAAVAGSRPPRSSSFPPSSPIIRGQDA